MSFDNSTLSIFFNSTLSTFANESQLKNKTVGRSYRASSSWGWWMLQIGTPLMMTTGLVGNLLSFIVLKSTRFRGKSYSHYLCTLAIFDSLVLVNKFIYRIDSLLIDTGRENIFAMFTDVACKIFNFGESVCHLMSTWLVLFMTIERFIAVRYPFKKDLLCRPRGVIIAILVVFSAMSYSQIYRLIMIESGGGACWASDRYRKVYLLLYIYGYQGVMFLLPALLILIFNILIIANIRRLSSIEQSGCAFESNPRYAENKERRAKLYNKTTVVLLLISFMHLLTQLPHLILSLFIYGPPDRRRSMYWLSKLRGLGSVLECFSETNYASNFYIYVLSGTKFRSALRHMWARQSRTTRQTRPVKTERAFYFRKLPASS